MTKKAFNITIERAEGVGYLVYIGDDFDVAPYGYGKSFKEALADFGADFDYLAEMLKASDNTFTPSGLKRKEVIRALLGALIE